MSSALVMSGLTKKSVHHIGSSQNRDLVTQLVNPSVVYMKKPGKVTLGKISTSSNGVNIEISNRLKISHLQYHLKNRLCYYLLHPALKTPFLLPQMLQQIPLHRQQKFEHLFSQTKGFIQITGCSSHMLLPLLLKLRNLTSRKAYTKLKLMSCGKIGKLLWTKSTIPLLKIRLGH